MIHKKLMILAALTVLLMSSFSARPATAAPAPSFPPDVSTTLVNGDDGDGNFDWQWDVFFGQKPALSHWVLIDLCPDVFEDIVAGSVYGGTGFSFGHDPTTNTDGLKFETENANDSGHALFGFSTKHCWEPGLLDVAFKSGQNVTFQDNVVGPTCDPCDDRQVPNAPEPMSLGLLGLGGLGMVRKLRRRK